MIFVLKTLTFFSEINGKDEILRLYKATLRGELIKRMNRIDPTIESIREIF